MSFELKFLCADMFPCEDSKTGSVCLSVPREKKSPFHRQYQSYISNWYINGMVFTSTIMRSQKFNILNKNMLTLVFLLSCFVNNFYLILCTLIGLLSYSIHYIQVGFNIYIICVNYIHIYILTILHHWTFIL